MLFGNSEKRSGRNCKEVIVVVVKLYIYTKQERAVCGYDRDRFR